MDIKNFITRFKNVKKVGEDEYTAICPAHDDKNPSLSIGLSKDKNQILVHCFAGCRTENVLNSVGLQFKDLYLETNRKSDEIATTTYIYKKADGSLAYEKTRIDYADGRKNFILSNPTEQKI